VEFQEGHLGAHDDIRIPAGDVKITFDWGESGNRNKFIDIDNSGDTLAVTLHPGLSHHQVALAAAELGEHGPAIIQEWERRTGFNS